MESPEHVTAAGQNQPKPPERTLGGSGKTLRVYTFAGGGFDTAMQLGVVHALLTASYDKPDVVTGVSAGAISAIALADILSAGEGEGRVAQHAAQVVRFRRTLEAYRDGPLQLLTAQLPDGYERNARQATENLKLPIHLWAERDGREQAQRSESGLIRLINELLAIKLPMRQAVLLIRIALGIREAKEVFGIWAALGEGLVLYQRLLLNLRYLSLPIGRLVLVLIRVCDDPPKSWPARRVLFRKRRFRRRWIDFWTALTGALAIIAWPLVYAVALLAAKMKRSSKGKVPDICERVLMRCVPKRWWNQFFSGRAGEECTRSILAHYELAKDLGDSNALRELFVDVFDPDYFGTLDMTLVGEDALMRKKDSSRPVQRNPKRLDQFRSNGAGGITVAVLAADINKSKVRPIPPDTPVVDALMAATAIAPIFRAVGLPPFEEQDANGNDQEPPRETVFYIDGENVNADPLRPTIKFLQKKIHFETEAVRFYSCVAFPISKQELPAERQFRGLVRVAIRSLELQRMQNALLERNFIKLYRDVLGVALANPGGSNRQPKKAVLRRTGPNGEETGPHKPLIAADVVSIEADDPLRLNEKIPAAPTHEARRALIDQAVADGCRATLDAWLRDPNEDLHATVQQLRRSGPNDRFIPCRKLIAAHLQRIGFPPPEIARPESDPAKGPGLMEICSSCRFFQERETTAGKILPRLDGFEIAPLNGTGGVSVAAKPPTAEVAPGKDRPAEIEPPGPPTDEPTVSLLFSGGVFRGVYQIGVANALLLLQLRPNVVAGASVGSITAALLAEVFSEPDDNQRKRKLCRLATSFLALDRLILTDRFYDFVRRLTLRAGDSDFSLRDLDLLFRRYDEGATATASARGRRTIAGLERLLYLSPYELNELVRAQRLQDYSTLYRLVTDHLQEMLDRNGAALEVLGAEPLAFLLTEHLLRSHPQTAVHRFDLFANSPGYRKIHLLATVTNLTKGKLRTLGSPYLHDTEWPVLKEGLLASSAFPGVFRPRNSWEIFPTSADQDQYVDGGVMDNLPFASVVGFLDAASSPASRTGVLPIYRRRPRAAHLIVTGSLEPNCHDLGPRRTDQVRRCWVSLRKRAGQIRYNKKIHDFEVAERDMHEIWEGTGLKPGAYPDEPLDIKVVAVKPEWLCGTFGFHPMLGFKRRRQAASIAHGCAGTLKEMSKLWREGQRPGGNQYFWQMEESIPESVTPEIVKRDPPGTCWFSAKIICPFSSTALDKLDASDASEAVEGNEVPAPVDPVNPLNALDASTSKRKLPPATRQALVSIYEECGKEMTHRPR